LRELREELGVSAPEPLEFLCKLDAAADTGQEFVSVYRASGVDAVDPNAEEIAAGGWYEPGEVTRWLARAPEEFTGTFRRIWARLGPALGG
jgi:hypothetical protein